MDDSSTKILIAIISFIIGIMVAVMPSSTVFVNGSDGRFYVEYKDKVYQLVEPETYNEQIKLTSTAGRP